MREDAHPSRGIRAGGVATGQCAVLGELYLGQRVPTTVLDRHAGQDGSERGEVELHLRGDRSRRPGHRDPVGRLPGQDPPPSTTIPLAHLPYTRPLRPRPPVTSTAASGPAEKWLDGPPNPDG